MSHSLYCPTSPWLLGQLQVGFHPPEHTAGLVQVTNNVHFVKANANFLSSSYVTPLWHS